MATSWDDMREGVTDKQPAAESLKYPKFPDWVEEHIVRDEQGVVIGKLVVRRLIHPERKTFVEMGIVDNRPEPIKPRPYDSPEPIAGGAMPSEEIEKLKDWMRKHNNGDNRW